MKNDMAGGATVTMTEPTPMQAAAIASGGGIWGDPAVELSTMGDQRQASRVRSMEVSQEDVKLISKKGNAIVMGCIAFSTGIASFLAGVITIAIPIMAKDLNIPENLVLWPVTVYSLACGCTLLACGSVSDVIGSRRMFLSGCFLQCFMTIACGLSKNTAQIIAFRSFSGIAASFCLPSAVSLINEVFPPGKERNITFAMMGGAQPFGFGIGMVLGGVFTGTIGWQWGFHVAAIINFFMFILAAWQLPPTPVAHKQRIWSRLATDIDWLGLILASGFLAMLSYVISALTGDLTVMRKPINIVLLVLSFVFLLAFVLWVGRQERLGRPALIPNSLWQHKGFSCICFNVFCVWAAFNAFEQYANFFFQDVQGNSPLGTALRFLPAPVSGALANVGVGLLVHRIRGDWIVVLTSIVSALASLLMAIIDPSWSYWRCAFVAQFFNPVGADGMFTVANLLITSMFPPGEQGVAGGVFNTISQTGKSVGMALTLLIAQQVTANSSYADKTSPEALMVGYRAAFWFCVALIVASLVVSVWGLRRIGKVGLKKD
ncbi:integral membrane protein [Aureobasidium pullulans]|nr:integral membrane protein [Aureobasidium pullulans]THY90197.1 integral membrane protein [Aureobasidium pullulans]